MYSLLVKHGQLIAFGLGLVITVIFLLSVFGGLSDFQALEDGQEGTTNIFNAGLYGAIALTILGVIAILGFGLYQTATNLKGAAKFLIGFAAIVVIFFIFYSMAQPVSGGRLAMLMEKFNITQGTSNFISGALGTALTLAGLAAGAFVLSEIRNLFK